MPPAVPNQATPPPVAATVHIYRGLMDRCYTWRTRIDNPTNWAVVTGGTATSFVLGDEAISHTVLLLIIFFNFAFLLIEARRYRYYDLWATWARLMETDFFATVLLDNSATLGEPWHKLLVRDMTYPHFKTSLLDAVGRRLRDNYLVIFLFLLFTWLLKLVIHPSPPSDTVTIDSFMTSAAIGPMPGQAVFGIVAASYLLLFGIALATRGNQEPSVEVLPRSRALQKLTSPYQQPVSRRRWGPSDHMPPEPPRPVEPRSRRPLDLED